MDDPRVEPRNDVRLKQMNLRVSNPGNMYEFGDFYGDFSPFVLSSSLQGLNLRLSRKIAEKSQGSFAEAKRLLHG